MNSTHRSLRCRSIGLVLLLSLGLGSLSFGSQAEPVGGLSEVQTRSLVARFKDAEHWSLKSIILLALGDRWHPLGSEMLVSSLESKDDHLRAYAVATLSRAHPEHLRSVATPELVEALIKRGLREKDDHFRSQVQSTLEKIFPGVEADKKSRWERHWRETKKQYRPTPWVGPGKASASRKSRAGVVERAMDLYEAGLEVAICIDSTGSMQPTIDASRDAVDDIISILRGVAPEFRLGLVHYKDFGDMGKVPAEVLEPLSKRPEAIEKRLSKLSAGGGGDAPERVEVGLEVALSREMKWKRSTNKLIVLIGDAPPHGGSPSKSAVQLVKDAFEKPFGLDPTDIAPTERTGRSRTNKVVRSFVTAAIAVGAEQIAPQTEQSFRRIANAGGGAYASLLTGQDAEEASREIARHIMRQSFGVQWKEQMDAFVDIYFEYHVRGFFD